LHNLEGKQKGSYSDVHKSEATVKGAS